MPTLSFWSVVKVEQAILYGDTLNIMKCYSRELMCKECFASLHFPPIQLGRRSK